MKEVLQAKAPIISEALGERKLRLHTDKDIDLPLKGIEIKEAEENFNDFLVEAKKQTTKTSGLQSPIGKLTPSISQQQQPAEEGFWQKLVSALSCCHCTPKVNTQDELQVPQLHTQASQREGGRAM